MKIYLCAISDACAYFQIAYKALDKDISEFLRVAAPVVYESWQGFLWNIQQAKKATGMEKKLWMSKNDKKDELLKCIKKMRGYVLRYLSFLPEVKSISAERQC